MADLIVSNIEEYAGTDGHPRYTVSFEGKKLTLTEKEKPAYNVGDVLPFAVRVHKPSEGQKGDWYYYRTESSSPQPSRTAPSQQRYSKNDDDIMLQVAFKGAIELITHQVPDGKIHIKGVLEATAELYAGLLLLRPKKEEK